MSAVETCCVSSHNIGAKPGLAWKGQETMSSGDRLPNDLHPFDMPTLAAMIDAAPLKTSLLTAGEYCFAYANQDFLSFVDRELPDLVECTMADVLDAPFMR